MAKLSKAQLISKAFGSKGQFAAVVGTKAERSSGIVLNKSAALTASAGMTSIASWNDYDSKRQYFDGDLLFVLDVRRTYMSDGNHWYLFSDAVTNQAPTTITGANASYELATDGTPIVLTLQSSDPEGIAALSWSYAVTTGTLGDTAIISQGSGANTNVFTITPSTTEAHAGTFSVTFSVTDGNSITTQVVDFTLTFIYAAQTQKIQVSSYDLNGKISWDDDGNTLIIAADTDRAFIWHRTGDVWTQAAVLQPQSGDTADSFGSVYSGLSMSGDGMTAVVGGIGIDHSDTSGAWGSWASAGGIYIYKRTGNSWSQQARIESPIVSNSIWFGRSTQLSRDGNVLIVNSQAHNNNNSSSGNYNYGKSFLYTRSGNTWTLIQTLAPAGSSHEYFQFGKFQALSGDGKQAVFCNWGDNSGGSGTGSLSFWNRTTGAFTNLISRTKATAWTAGDHYGERPALDYLGETCVVGTPLYDNGKGNVHVWTRSGNSWSQQQDISNPLSTGSFGSDVDITSDGNMIIIGASGSNKIYIYEKSGSTWTETASFDADDTTSGDQLGEFVQVSDDKDKFIASSPGQTDGATYYFNKL